MARRRPLHPAEKSRRLEVRGPDRLRTGGEKKFDVLGAHAHLRGERGDAARNQSLSLDFDPARLRVDETLKSQERRLRRARVRRDLWAAITAAISVSGTSRGSKRFHNRRHYFEREMRLAMHEVNELRAARDDCGDDAFMQHEVMEARLASVKRGTMHAALGDDSARQAEYQRDYRRERRLALDRLPPAPPPPPGPKTLEEAHALLAREVRASLERLCSIMGELGDGCADDECLGPLVLSPDGAFTPVEGARTARYCRHCRELLLESDSLKEDVRVMSGGTLRMQLIGFKKRRGRPPAVPSKETRHDR